MDLYSSEMTAARLRKSCETCRGLKLRCCPSVVNDEKCHRCIKEGKQCFFLEAKPRQKRSKNSRVRVAEMEQKLENIYALLSQTSSGSEAAKEDSTDASIVASDSPPEVQKKISTYPPYLDAISTYGPLPPLPENIKPQSLPVSTVPYLVLDTIQDVISKGIISFAEGEECLTSFQQVASSFPFVIITPQSSLEFLRREKPSLLLAILTFGSYSRPKIFDVLEHEFREMLSKKVIMNGEKSLDLLQGVLVYLNYYHLHFKIGRQQIYQLSQIAATMAVELHIHLTWQNASNIDGLAIPIPDINGPNVADEIEGKRTFLGTYYLTSAICLCLRKPYTLKNDEYVQECSQILGQLGVFETDYLIPYFIGIQSFIEEVTSAYQCNIPQKLPLSDSVHIENMFNAFKQRLSLIEMAFPPEIRNHPTIAISLHSLKIYMTEVGFHATNPSPFELMSGDSAQSWYYSNARKEVLISCLQAAKDYLDFFLALPNKAILKFSLPDFLRLMYAVLVLGIFATDCGVPTLDGAFMRNASDLSHYLDALNTKTTSMITYTGSEENRDFVWHMRCIFQKTKSFYSFNDAPSPPFENPRLDGADMGFMNLLPSVLGKCNDSLAILPKPTEVNADAEYVGIQPWSDLTWALHQIVDHSYTFN